MSFRVLVSLVIVCFGAVSMAATSAVLDCHGNGKITYKATEYSGVFQLVMTPEPELAYMGENPNEPDLVLSRHEDAYLKLKIKAPSGPMSILIGAGPLGLQTYNGYINCKLSFL